MGSLLNECLWFKFLVSVFLLGCTGLGSTLECGAQWWLTARLCSSRTVLKGGGLFVVSDGVSRKCDGSLCQKSACGHCARPDVFQNPLPP